MFTNTVLLGLRVRGCTSSYPSFHPPPRRTFPSFEWNCAVATRGALVLILLLQGSKQCISASIRSWTMTQFFVFLFYGVAQLDREHESHQIIASSRILYPPRQMITNCHALFIAGHLPMLALPLSIYCCTIRFSCCLLIRPLPLLLLCYPEQVWARATAGRKRREPLFIYAVCCRL